MKKKFSVLDGFIALVALAIIAGGVIYFTGRDQGNINQTGSGKVNIVFVAEADNIPEAMLRQLEIGDQLVASGRFQDAKIKDIEIYKSTDISAVDGEIVSYELEETRRLVVTIQGQVNKYGPYIDLGGQEIKAGSPYYIKTDQFEAYGNVVNIQDIGE